MKSSKADVAFCAHKIPDVVFEDAEGQKLTSFGGLVIYQSHARRRPSLQISYETLRVYQLALQFLLFAAASTLRLPRGNGPIADQLRGTEPSR